jgi:hypothetical protein
LADIDLTPLPASAKGSTGQLHNLEMSVEANRNRALSKPDAGTEATAASGKI